MSLIFMPDPGQDLISLMNTELSFFVIFKKETNKKLLYKVSDVKLYLKVVSWDFENNLLWMKSAFTQHRARASIALLSSCSTTIKLIVVFSKDNQQVFGFTHSIYLKSNLLDTQGFFRWV